jgi:hypothetical protein
MKQHEANEKQIGGNMFFIRPFPAMRSIEVHGDLLVALAPLLAPLASESGEKKGNAEGGGIADIDISVFLTAMSSLSGEKLTGLLNKLLIKYGNVSVETEDGVKNLDREIFDEVFCAEIQDAFILSWEVIRVNFPSIFKKVGSLFGNQKITQMIGKLTSTED